MLVIKYLVFACVYLLSRCVLRWERNALVYIFYVFALLLLFFFFFCNSQRRHADNIITVVADGKQIVTSLSPETGGHQSLSDWTCFTLYNDQQTSAFSPKSTDRVFSDFFHRRHLFNGKRSTVRVLTFMENRVPMIRCKIFLIEFCVGMPRI